MGKGAQNDNERWLQQLIAGALSIGISKRELLEDYYMDEISAVIEAWNRLHDPEHASTTEQVDALTFFGDGGEMIDA